jgi:hypothetical protein
MTDATRRQGGLEEETIMKRIIILVALAFALAAGSVTMMTIHPQQATTWKPAAVRGSTPVLVFQPHPWQGTFPLSI